jgi:translation initiation factor 3 subunit J
MQAMELQSDLHHAEDLFGSGSGPSRKPPTITSVVVDPKDPSSRTVDLASLAIFNPDSKLAFDRLRDVLVPLISKNSKAPGYNVFCQEFARAISQGLNGSEQIRLVASKLTTLANERLKEEKAAEKGKKGKKAEKKASLAASGKEMDRLDTKNYEDEYHDLYVLFSPFWDQGFKILTEYLQR